MGLRQDIETLKKQLAEEASLKKESMKKIQGNRANVEPVAPQVKPATPQPQPVVAQTKPVETKPQQVAPQAQPVNPENLPDLEYFVYCYKNMKVKFQKLLYNGNEIGFRIRYGNRGIDFFYNSFKRASKYKNFAEVIHTTLKPELSDTIIAGEKGAGTKEEFEGKIKVKDVQVYIKEHKTKIIDIIMERVEAALKNTLPDSEKPLVANWGLHR